MENLSQSPPPARPQMNNLTHHYTSLLSLNRERSYSQASSRVKKGRKMLQLEADPIVEVLSCLQRMMRKIKKESLVLAF